MDQGRENRLKRLRLRSWRRGMKEMDLILGGFADTELSGLEGAALDAHEALMAEPDQDIYSWISGAAPTPAQHQAALEPILRYLSARTF